MDRLRPTGKVPGAKRPFTLPERLRQWREDPVLMVRQLFGVEPDPWQLEVLREFPTRNRIAMQACKGPGKTAALAWCIWNFLLTRPHPKIAATSISANNLADNLWTELAKWQNTCPLLKEMFVWTKTRIFAKDHPETWWASARAWSQSADSTQQENTLAGLHADYLLFVLDESGGIPNSVMAAAEAGLSTGVETKILQAGNPTHLEGPLYDAATRDRHLWYVVEITGDPDDPKRSSRVSADWAREQIVKWGRENPWVLVNVFGKFPPSSINTLLTIDEVRAAMARHLAPDLYQPFPKVIGVDVARHGDDSTVLFPRQGRAAFQPVQMRNASTDQISGRLAQAEQKWGAEYSFVDATGGWGWGVIDFHRQLGRDPIPVEFSAKSSSDRFANKRTEMWFAMAQWIKEGGALPEVPELVAELSTPTYTFKGDRLLLEPKEQIKERLGRSPDFADALALTFAQPVTKPEPLLARQSPFRESSRSWDYDPLSVV
jgi:hypothetical protein